MGCFIIMEGEALVEEAQEAPQEAVEEKPLSGPAPEYPAPKPTDMSPSDIEARRHERVHERTIRFLIEGPNRSQNGRQYW